MDKPQMDNPHSQTDTLQKGLALAESFLSEEQQSIVKECMIRTSFGLSLPMGHGKCHAKDTPILMYDGSIKKVQDIEVGDLLMGDDSTPRTVLSLGRGRDTMYAVVPEQGETYTFNSEHILSLKLISLNGDIHQKLRHSTINKYRTKHPKLKNLARIYKVPVEFPETELDNIPDPYEFSKLFAIKNTDGNIIGKYIPDILKINSSKVRSAVLAGILDSLNSYTVNSPNEDLIDDIIYIARSLGLTAYKTIHGDKFETTVGGDVSLLPLRTLETIKLPHGITREHTLLSKFKVVKKKIDDYYGFEIDGNHLYLMGDFTVTHNTVVSLVTGVKRKIQNDNPNPILVIASKSLIPSWEVEINKFFKNYVPYQVINTDSKNFTLKPTTQVVLVTAETAGKFYKDNEIDTKFITREIYADPRTRWHLTKNVYDAPVTPYLKNAVGGSIIYQKNWACLIIDEGHKYTKISTNRCQALGAICAKYRMILSGTLFDEPDFERILGYYITLHYPNFPNNLPDALSFLKSSRYRGTKETIIERGKIELTATKVNKHIIQHNLTEEEGQIYVSMKKTLAILRNYCKRAVRKEDRKKFSVYLLCMITYIRQSVVVPILPIANIALEMSEISDMRSELSVLLMDQFNKLNLSSFLNDEASARSSRVSEVIKILGKHNKSTDKIIVFSCFCTSLDMLAYYVNEELPIGIYKLSNTLSIQARGKLIDNFQKSEENSILFTTFELGSEGLNLQCANVVVILDFWWNNAKTQQAVARVVRRGQEHSDVDIYFFTSNTGIEKALFAKQQDKLVLLEEIKTGSIKHSVKSLRMEEVLKLIDANENYDFLTRMC